MNERPWSGDCILGFNTRSIICCTDYCYSYCQEFSTAGLLRVNVCLQIETADCCSWNFTAINSVRRSQKNMHWLNATGQSSCLFWRYLDSHRLYIIIALVIDMTIFMVLSSWQSHCESLSGLFDECRYMLYTFLSCVIFSIVINQQTLEWNAVIAVSSMVCSGARAAERIQCCDICCREK